MPTAIGAAVSVVSKFLAEHAVIKFFASVAATLLISEVTQKLFGPKAPASSFAGLQTTSRGSLEPRKILYGEGKVGGVVTYNNVRGTDNMWQDLEISYLDHKAEAISFFIDEKEIVVADIDWTPATADSTAGAGTGNVSDTDWINNSVNALKIQWQVGWDNQPANVDKVANYTQQTSAHQLRGTFNAIFSMLFDKDTAEIWKDGNPQRMNVLAKGRRVYDRRKHALNSDPNFITAEKSLGGHLKWYENSLQTTLPSTGFDTFSVTAGTLTVTDNDDTEESIFSERFPVDTSKRYTTTARARQTAGDRKNFLLVAFYDSAGDLINNTSTPVSDATGWGSIGTFHYYDIVDAVFTGSYVTYELDFGSGGSASIPTGAVTMAVGALLTRDGAVGTATTIDIQDMAIYEGVLADRHDPDDELTWEFSDNPANCMADYLTQYMGVDIDEDIDWPSVIVAAQACDVVVDIPGPSTEKRFSCNGALFTDQDHEAVLEQLKESMSGSLVWTAGKWFMRAGIWEAATETIDSTWLAGAVSVSGSSTQDERYNFVTGHFIDPARDYEFVEFSPVTQAAFVTRDGGKELPFDIRLQFANSEYASQRGAIRKLEQFDNQKVATLLLNKKGLKVVPGKEYFITLPEFSFSAKSFRCINWNPTPEGNFECTFKEDFSSRYDDPLIGDYTTKTSAGAVIPPARTVTPPTGLAAVGKAGLIELSWVNPPASLFDYTEVWRSATNDIDTASKIAEIRTSVYLDFVSSTTEFFYWIRSKAFIEKFSLYEPSTTAGVAGTALSAGGSVFFYIKPTNGTAIQNGSGTLTIEARKVDGSSDVLLSSGTIKLFEGSTEITVANGYATGSDGFTGVLDSGDITGNAIITLKDGSGGAALDSITLVDIADGNPGADGDNAVNGFIEPDPTLAWTRATNAGAWDPTATTTDLDATFVQGGNIVCKIARRITRNAAGVLTVSTIAHKDSNLNLSRVTPVVQGSGTASVTVEFPYSFGGDQVQVSETVRTAQGGDDGPTGPDGQPGLPGASTITLYDNIDSSGAASSQGRYHMLTSISNTSGIFVWATITTLGGVNFFSLHKDSTGGAIDHSAFYAQVKAGDVLTWWKSDRRWVSFRITSIETAPTDMFKWGISLISFDEADGTGPIIDTAGNNVLLRFSRALTPSTSLGRITAIGEDLQDVTASIAEVAYRVDNDGDIYSRSGDGSSFVSIGTWLNSGIAGDYEMKFEDSGNGNTTPVGAAQDTWISCSSADSNRTVTLTDTSTSGGNLTYFGNVRFRDKITFEELGVATLDMIVQRTV